MNNPIDLLIIGGGASAVAVIAALGKQTSPPTFVLAERAASPGLGVAYSTELEQHILNVPAALMGIDAERPEGFFNWCSENHVAIAPTDFVSRQVYGRYLQEVLNRELQRQSGNIWATEVVSLEKAGGVFRATGADGRSVMARRVVMATGHTSLELPTGKVTGESDSRLAKSPWQLEGYRDIEKLRSIVIIGTGLTAMDVVGALDQRGYSGTLLLISRRGLLPFSSTGAGAPGEISVSTDTLHLPLRALVRWVREQVKVLTSQGSDWRCLIDAFRPHISALWRGFSAIEQRQFQRHLRPYWEVVRHRMPTHVRERVDQLIKQGRLRVLRARVRSINLPENSPQLQVTVSTSEGTQTIAVDRLFNCTGGSALKPEKLTGLLASMQQHNLITVDRFGLGVLTTVDGETLDSAGQVVERCFVVGPLRRASEWESTAMREVRQQAAVTARLLSLSA